MAAFVASLAGIVRGTCDWHGGVNDTFVQSLSTRTCWTEEVHQFPDLGLSLRPPEEVSG